MTTTTFRMQGDPVPRPVEDLNEIGENILRPFESRWTSGKGSISLRREGRMLVVMRNARRGFVVILNLGSRHHPLGDVLIGSDSAEGSDEVWGSEMMFPLKCFVSGALAMKAVEHFVLTGEHAPELTWLAGDELHAAEL